MLLFIGLVLLFLCHTNAAYTNELQDINAIDDNLVIKDLKTTPLKKYSPTWEDLDKRPLPEWYDRAKIGIFLHWGVYSVPSFGSEWFWKNWSGHTKNKVWQDESIQSVKEAHREGLSTGLKNPSGKGKRLIILHIGNNTKYVNFMKNNYRPGFTYQDFAPQFSAEFFDPDEWAKLFVNAGAKYVVITSKHHEGYTLFPSKRSYSWNSVDVGPHRDIVKQLSESVRKQNIKFGVYHSLYEWFNPIYLEDKKTLFKTKKYVDEKLWPDLKQLVNDYNPSVIWADGDWEAAPSYWNSTDFLAWLYNESPVRDEIVVNDRWGIGTACLHGDFFNCQDRYNPNTLQKHKWENAFTLDSVSWGYRRNINIHDLLCIHCVLKEIVTTVSCGGNAIINIGPTKEGTIIPIFQERLLELGAWLKVNGEAIYGTSPWTHQNDTLNGNVWYTCTKPGYNGRHPTAPPSKNDKILAIYAIILKWPANNVLEVKDLTSYLRRGTERLTLLGNEEENISWVVKNGTTYISLPSLSTGKSRNAWVLKLNSRLGLPRTV